MVKHKVLNIKKYNHDQLVDMLTCPLNRNGTREEHSCDDWELYKHPEWLVEHYLKHGGAEHWAKRRAEYEVEIDDEKV